MANLKAALVRYCKTPVGWRRYPAVIGKNGKVKPTRKIMPIGTARTPLACQLKDAPTA